MRELDVLLEAHLDRQSPTMTTEELRVLERFLDASDMDLYAWLTRRSVPANVEFAALLDAILDQNSPASSNR